MQLETAQRIADQVVEKLKPYCSRIEVAGSIRRKKSWVNDIDIVAIPSNQGQFVYALQQLGSIKLGGQKIIRVARPDIELDVYVATPETWATLLLIRTGSAAHNIGMCKLAHQKGMKLHADGSGLFQVERAEVSTFERRIAGDTEASIFEALGLKYKRPEERE
jgi:DNA polymerase (family 10)